MIREAIEAVVSGRSLTRDESVTVMEEIMSGLATPSQIASFITALRIKGESIDEIVGLASVMRIKATQVKATPPIVDTAGTGGDFSNSFNISTAAAFIAAGAGLKVAKHGNRAMSSRCGSADVLEALGVKIDLGAEDVAKCLEDIGIGFIFAPIFHPAMKYAASIRKEIGIRTVFNILGPLTNPAGAQHQVIGVPIKELAEKMAHVLCHLGTNHSLVVHGLNGMDECSISSKSLIWEINNNGISPVYEVSPQDFGFKLANLSEIKGGTPQENAYILRSVLEGKNGPKRNVVIMNAAAILVAGNLAKNLREGVHLAENTIDNGRALAKLDELINFSRSLG